MIWVVGRNGEGGIDMQRNGCVADKVNSRGIDIHPPAGAGVDGAAPAAPTQCRRL